MRGTKLSQRAGSPLISGRSRNERSFMRDWLLAWLVAFLLGYLSMVAVMAVNGSGLETALRAVWIPAIPASALGAVPGVWIARRLGWRRPWVLGGIVGAVLVAGATIAFVLYLVSRLNG